MERIFSRPKDILEPVLLNYLVPETVDDVVGIANRGGGYTRHEADFFKGLDSELQVRSHTCAFRCHGPWIDSPPIKVHGLHLICSFVSRSPYTVVGVSVTVVISVRVELDAQLFHYLETANCRCSVVIDQLFGLFVLALAVNEFMLGWRPRERGQSFGSLS